MQAAALKGSDGINARLLAGQLELSDRIIHAVASSRSCAPVSIAILRRDAAAVVSHKGDQ